MPEDLFSLDLTRGQFESLGSLLHESCGIKLCAGKESLVKSRLMKRLRALGLNSFDAYLERLQNDPSKDELGAFIDALTTNKTSFFREPQHFSFLQNHIIPRLAREPGRIRIWTAGCSSGEEPYSTAITLREALADVDERDILILATDISTKMLRRAKEATYHEQELEGISPSLMKKYFRCSRSSQVQRYVVNEGVRRMVKFAWLNLMGEWPMKGPFDVIFCRNVMIYFEKCTQQWLIDRFWNLLKPGGYLMVGHSESLTGSNHRFRYVQPATYVK